MDQNLINAAPDLLAALEAFVKDMEENGEIHDFNGNVFPEYANAKRAIAKAKGEPEPKFNFKY